MPKNKSKGPEFVEFDFQEMPLQEAVMLCAAGDGKYAEVAAKLIEKMPGLVNEGKTLAFGMPDGKELDENARRGLCTSIASAMKRAGIDYRVTYSNSRKIFIVVPRGKSKPARNANCNGHSNGNGSVPSVISLANLKSLAAKTFGLSDDLDGLTRNQYKAIARVGLKQLAYKPKDIAPIVGKRADTVWWAGNVSKGAEIETKELAAAVRNGGGYRS